MTLKSKLLCLGILLTIFSTLHFWLPSPVWANSKTLVYSWSSNAGPLNPHHYSPNQMFAQAMLYEPLVKYGPGGKILPCLAERWEISSDGREYVFVLRKGVTFSDGTPFNARAVKKNIDAVLANARRHSWLELINQIQETVEIDDYAFKLALKNPYYPTLQELSLIRPLRFLSPSAFPESGCTVDGLKAPIGTGQWVLAESKLGEYDIFLRNEEYWGEMPGIHKIVVKVILDPNTRAVAFETKEIDLIYGTGQINLDGFDRFRKSGRHSTQVSQPLASRVIALNSNRGPTRDFSVRKAILHAVNKAAIIHGIFLDTEVLAETLFSPNTPYCDLGLNPYVYDPALAEKLLEEAGWRRRPGKAFRSREGQPLEVAFCFVGNDAIEKAIAEVIQADLKRIGIKTRLIGEEKDSFYNRQREGEFGMIFGNTWGAPYDPHSFVSSMRMPAHADYQAQIGMPMKSEIDAKIGQVLITTDEKKRREIYRYILTTLHEQGIYLPLSYQTGIIVHREDLDRVSYGHTKYEIPFETMVKK